MKRIATSFCLIILLPSLAFAGSLFSVGFGSINQFQLDPFNVETQVATIIDVHNWATGGEVRVRFLGVNIDAYMLVQQGDIIAVTENGMPVFEDDVSQRLFGMVGLGVSTKVASFTTLSFSAGTLTGLDVKQDFSVAFWMGDRNNVLSQTDWKDFYTQIPLAYRLRLDLNLGSFSLGFHYQVPSQGYSIAYHEAEALIPAWDQGKIGFSLINRFL